MAVGNIHTEGELKRWLERELGATAFAPKGPQIKGMIVPEDFTAPTFTNSWVNYGGAFQSAGYMRDRQGFIHLRGTVKNGTAGASIFTLPAGYRPAATVAFAVVRFGGISNALVTSSGTVTPEAGAGNTLVSLDGITFKAA